MQAQLDYNQEYYQALKLEQRGNYMLAFELYYRCFRNETILDKGNILFHCGKCLEVNKSVNKLAPLTFYEAALTKTTSLQIKMNCNFRIGWIEMHRKNFSKAAEYFKNAIMLGESILYKGQIYVDSVYWFSVCLETLERFYEAIKNYKIVRSISQQLYYECSYRIILCCIHVGAYNDALDECRSFENEISAIPDRDRYEELKLLVNKKQLMLLNFFNPKHPFINVD